MCLARRVRRYVRNVRLVSFRQRAQVTVPSKTVKLDLTLLAPRRLAGAFCWDPFAVSPMSPRRPVTPLLQIALVKMVHTGSIPLKKGSQSSSIVT